MKNVRFRFCSSLRCLELRALIVWVALVTTASAGWALSLDPNYVPPTYAERWDKSPIVIYGRVTRLQRTEVAEHQTYYEMSLEIERVWKGDLKGEIKFKDMLPDGFSAQGYRFEFDKTYVIFAYRDSGEDFYVRSYAEAVVLPLPPRDSLQSIFGTNGGIANGAELMECIEAKSGNKAAADKIRAELEAPEKERRLFIENAKKEFSAAMKEQGVSARLALLDKLERKLQFTGHAEELVELRKRVASELIVATTYSNNGVTKFY